MGVPPGCVFATAPPANASETAISEVSVPVASSAIWKLSRSSSGLVTKRIPALAEVGANAIGSDKPPYRTVAPGGPNVGS